MTAVKVWSGSAWADSPITEKAWDGSAWVNFAPGGGGPTLEALSWPSPPSNPNGQDSVTYSLGMRFNLVTAKSCYGVQWRVPDTPVAPAGGVYYAKLWSFDSQSELAATSFTPAAAGSYQSVLFTGAVALSASPSQYVASIFTRGYNFRAPSPSTGWVVTSPSGNIRGDQARLFEGNTPSAWLNQSFNAWYYISPLVAV